MTDDEHGCLATGVVCGVLSFVALTVQVLIWLPFGTVQRLVC